ncbi:glycolate oxidase [Micrococcales bacterium KH10]|nr:glycolate oxidase [Micrococcales bacterium KH10]
MPDEHVDLLPEELLGALRSALGAEHVSTDESAIAPRLTDSSGMGSTGRPLALVRPGSTAEVSQVLAAANRAKVAVVPQGALTGLAGAASALVGSILLDLSRMDRIVDIDEVNRLAVVQPGVLVADFGAEVARHGLFYPPDPASAARATIGGTVATNAGGMRAIKYGLTRDYVRSLEVVLADGSVVRTRPPTRKSVAALDLTGLMVGSEGTLGVITEVTLALLPAPAPLRGISGTFASMADALAAARDIGAGSRLPVTLELLDGVVLDAVKAYDPTVNIPAGAGAWLLALTDAHLDPSGDLDAFETAYRAHGALSIERGEDEAALDQLIAARRLLHPAMLNLRGVSINEDIAVLPSRLGEITAAIGQIAADLGVVIGVGGHVGDGNMHPVIAYDPDNEAETAAAWRAHEQIMALAPRFGGTITAEHGIGVEKLVALDGEVSPALRAAQRAIKAALDPNEILNPGRKF